MYCTVHAGIMLCTVHVNLLVAMIGIELVCAQIQSAYSRLGKRELSLDVLTVAFTSALHTATFDTVRSFATSADGSSSDAYGPNSASALPVGPGGGSARGVPRSRSRKQLQQQPGPSSASGTDGERPSSTSGTGLSGPSLQQFSEICKVWLPI